MGLFDWLTGTKKPEDDVPVRSADEVRAALLAVNRPTAPFTVRDSDDEQADLVAEWRIVDATWYEIFAKAGLTKVAQVLMRLDPAEHEVRATDKEWTVQWRAGTPELSLEAEGFRGQQKSMEFGKAYAFTEHGEYGEVYNYHFDTDELKDPLQDAVTAAGWTWRGVAFGKL